MGTELTLFFGEVRCVFLLCRDDALTVAHISDPMKPNPYIRTLDSEAGASRTGVRNHLPFLITIAAVAAGTWLRLLRLGALQMAADEGASWAAAQAPALAQVIAIQATHNAGKLPFHDVLLHVWIVMFGDSLFAMRTLSVLFGVVTLLMVPPTTQEVLRIGRDDHARELSDGRILSAGALASMLCAVNVIFIKYDDQARMYALLLAVSLAQVWLFLRTVRRQSLLDAGMLTLLTAGILAANLVTAPLLATEGIWILVTLRGGHTRAALTAGFAMLAGLILLSPALYHMAVRDMPMVQQGGMNWINKPPWWEPAAFFSKALGSFAFPVFALLAAWGCTRLWSDRQRAIQFALLWMWAPPVLLVIGSYLWRPMFVERYALYSFPPLFILAALGICSLRNSRVRTIAALVVVAFSLGHLHSYWSRPHDTDWRSASQMATAALAPGETVAVLPNYAVEAVRYYMSPSSRPRAVPFGADQRSGILILGAQMHSIALQTEAEKEFPQVLGRFRGVKVLSR